MSTGKQLDPRYLALSLRQHASLLRVGQFPASAEILEQFANVIETRKADERFFNENYPKLETALRKEFTLGANWRPGLFDDADAIIKVGSLALETLQIVEPTKVRQENVNRIMITAMKETDEVAQIYLLCFVYLLLLEGIYDEFMRFLYALHKKLSTTGADLRSIRTQFSQDGVGGTLFSGWNSTVRNGIAHSTFTVDEASKQLLFEDRISGKKERMSFNDFRELTQKLLDVGTAVLVLLMLRILTPLNYQEALKSSTKCAF